MASSQEHIVHETGDLDVVIQGHKFRVSSATMASLSLPFNIIFNHPDEAGGQKVPVRQITLPLEPRMFHQVIHRDSISEADSKTLMELQHALSMYDREPEIFHRIVQSSGVSQSETNTLVDLAHALLVHEVDPAVFHFIAQSAHGIFLFWTTVSIDTLVGLARAISVYQVPETADIYAFVNYAFISHTAIPASIEEKNLPKFAQIAEALDPKLLLALLQDIFDLHCCHWVPVSISNYCDQLLANVILQVVGTRAKIAQRLLGNTPDRLLTAVECHLFSWLIENNPSLSSIQSRFQAEISALQSDEGLSYRLVECLEFLDTCRSGIVSYLFVMISSKQGRQVEPCEYNEVIAEGQCVASMNSPSIHTESAMSPGSPAKTWPLEDDENKYSIRN